LSTSCKKNRTRAREPKNPDVDKCVYKWFKQTSDNKIPLSEKAEKSKSWRICITRKLEKHNFKASNGWLNSFKQRNGICLKTIIGESGDIQVADDWKIKLQQMIREKKIFLQTKQVYFKYAYVY